MDFSNDDFSNDEDENRRTQYGVLKVTAVGGDQDPDGLQTPKEFEVFGGETRIGRDDEQCEIVINNKVKY